MSYFAERNDGIARFRAGDFVKLENGVPPSLERPCVFGIKRLSDGLFIYIGRTCFPQRLIAEYERKLAAPDNRFRHTKQFIPHSYRRGKDYEFVPLYALPRQVRSMGTQVKMLVNAKSRLIGIHETQGRGQGRSDTGEFSNA